MGDGQPNTFSQGLEPEYVTFDPMVPVAYVSLQVCLNVTLFYHFVYRVAPNKRNSRNSQFFRTLL